MDMSGYLAIERVLEKRRIHAESVKGKEKPFRVEFRYRRGTKHWVYFCTLEDAMNADDDAVCKYGPFGNAIIEWPLSRQIQIEGPRGGWNKYQEIK